MTKYLLVALTFLFANTFLFVNISYSASPVTLCNPLAEIACGLPFPSNLYLDSDTNKLNYSDEILDTRVSGALRSTNSMLSQFPEAFRPSNILNSSTGFSPLGAVMFELELMPTDESIESIGDYLKVYDLDTDELINMVVTLSPMAMSERSVRIKSSVIAAWPRSRFEFEHRFVAVLLKGIEGRQNGLAYELEPSEGVVSVLAGSGTSEVNEALAPIISFINEKGIESDTILSFTHFTIRSEAEITAPLMAMVEYVSQATIVTDELSENDDFMGSEELGDITLKGNISLINFRSEDGGVYEPYLPITLLEQEETDFLLSIPKWDKESAIPIQVMGHGLASDKSIVNADFQFSDELGMATFIIDWPNHGARVWLDSESQDSSQSAAFPHVVEVCAGPTAPQHMMQFLGMFVQGAVDQAIVIRGVNSALPAALASYSSEYPALNPDKIVYKGGSFGAMIGSMVGAVTPELKGAYLSAGTGSLMHVLSESIFWDGGVGNLIPQNINGAEAAFVMGMMQQYLDIADSLNFAHYYKNPPNGLEPRKLSLSYAIDDGVMPNTASLAFAEIVDLPMLKEVIVPAPHIYYGVEGIADHIDGYGIVHAEFGESDAARAIAEFKAFDDDRYTEVIESNDGFEDSLNDFVAANSEIVDLVGQTTGVDIGGAFGTGNAGENVVASLIDEVFLGETVDFMTHWARSVSTRRAKINWHCEVLELDPVLCADAIAKAELEAEEDDSQKSPGFDDLDDVVDVISDFEGFDEVGDIPISDIQLRNDESGGAFGWIWALCLSIFGLIRRGKELFFVYFNKPYIRVLTLSVGAAVFFGGWAFVANYNDIESRLSAGLVQAVLSFSSNLVGTFILEGVYSFHESRDYRELWTVITMFTMTFVGITAIHLWNGTANLMLTIVPILCVTTTSCAVYVFLLKKLSESNVNAEAA